MGGKRAGTRKVQFAYLIRDLENLRNEGDKLLATPIQAYSTNDDNGFSDGPVHQRVAVVDLDPKTLSLRLGASFHRQGIGKTVSCYDQGDKAWDPDSAPEHFETDNFLQVNPFAIVLKMLDFFEGPEILGRQICWAFPSNQLLVVPRAGEMKNAFYDRDTGSLQFFYHEGLRGYTIYTALSHDIVAHEATHAILDAIAPDLYHAITPQSLAIHEAIADLSAITQILLNRMVVFSLEAISSSQIDPLEALSYIAEEFGTDIRISDGASFLRRLRNQRTLDPSDKSVDEYGSANRPDSTDLHALSQVLSGAVYAVFENRMKVTRRSGRAGFPMLEEAFCPAARRVARIVFRALDYLPPGEASFADYGRAFLAAAAATYKRPQKEQRWLSVDFKRLIEDDDAARRFANDHRELLGIPGRRNFEVLPPVVAARSFGSRQAKDRNEELVFKVRWKIHDKYDLGDRFPSKWIAAQGTTLVVDLPTGRILSLLTTEASDRQYHERGALLRHWANEGRLLTEAESIGPNGKPMSEAVIVRTIRNVAHAGGGGKTLHMAAEVL